MDSGLPVNHFHKPYLFYTILWNLARGSRKFARKFFAADARSFVNFAEKPPIFAAVSVRAAKYGRCKMKIRRKSQIALATFRFLCYTDYGYFYPVFVRHESPLIFLIHFPRKERSIHMKLIFAVVNGDDSAAVSKALSKNGFPATKLASAGSFLSAGNTTFLICVEEDKVDDVIGVVKQKCHHRKQFVPSASSYGAAAGAPPAMPLEVSVGGATIFVTDIERFEKL